MQDESFFDNVRNEPLCLDVQSSDRQIIVGVLLKPFLRVCLLVCVS